MQSDAFSVGAAAAIACLPMSANPYNRYSDKSREWRAGWRSVIFQGPRRPVGSHWNPPRQMRDCLYCGTPMSLTPFLVDKKPKKFCSYYCSGKYHFGRTLGHERRNQV
jgi:hypothetical protein